MFAAAILILLSFIILQNALRPEEARIRRNLRRLGSLLSKSEGEAIAAGLIRANRAAEYFDRDCRISINGFNINGRAELQSAIHSARGSLESAGVRFPDVKITFKDENTASARVTATVSANGLYRDTTARELKLLILKHEGEWKIKSAETVEVLR